MVKDFDAFYLQFEALKVGAWGLILGLPETQFLNKDPFWLKFVLDVWGGVKGSEEWLGVEFKVSGSVGFSVELGLD